MMMTGDTMFRSTWRRAMPMRDEPIAVAANTYSRSRCASTSARTRRAYNGHQAIMMAITAFFMPAPSAAEITMARMTVGNDSMRSLMRIMVSSTTVGERPATIPTTVPTLAASATAANPMEMEMRAPKMIRLKISRPSASVPRM